MPWSPKFIETLDQPSKEVHFILKFIQSSKDYSLTNGQQYTTTTEVRIGASEVTIDSSQITPQRWSINFGGFTIVLNGDLRPILSKGLRKGAVAELIMVRNGFRNRVNIGQLRSITGGRGIWTLEFSDFLSVLQARLTTKIAETEFWYNAGKTAKLTQNFNISSSANLYLDDITMFEKETSQNGIIKVEDVSSGAIDYWTWSSKTTTSAPAGYLTIASTGNYPNTGSAITVLAINDIATSLARLRGRPDYVFARLVMSTGSGTQGAFDDYPSSWSSGVEWNPNLFNLQNLNAYYQTNWATSSGTHEIDVLISQPSNINTFLDAVLSMGMWPTWYQNELTWRVCQNPNQAPWISVQRHLTDRDIVSIDSHQLYSISQSVVYGKSIIRTYNTSTSQYELNTSSGTSIAMLPSEESITRDLSEVYRIDSPVQSVQADADLKRLQRWDKEPYEELDITVHEKHCLLTSGDIVEISSKYIYGLREPTTDTYSNRRAMVLGVRWNPMRGTVNLKLGVVS